MKTVAVACFAVALWKLAIVASNDVESSIYQEIALKATTDQVFVLQATEAGMVEVALGRLAFEKASSGEVKELARAMVDFYSKVNQELEAMAKDRGVMLPVECVPCRQRIVAIEKLDGEEFDRKIKELLISDYNDVVTKFSSESSQGNDADLKVWASRHLADLRSLGSQHF